MNIQRLFQISKAEIISFVRNFAYKAIREGDSLIVGQLVLPVLGIKDTLIPVRILEIAAKGSISRFGDLTTIVYSLLAIESAGSPTEPRIELLKMIRSADDKQSVVAL